MSKTSISPRDLESIEHSNDLAFALKWSSAGTAIALCLMLSGCDSFFPKETPRYNTVTGERRVPMMNAQMLAPQAAQQAAPVPMVSAQPAQPAPQAVYEPAPAVITAPPMQQAMYEQQPAPAIVPQPAPQPAMMEKLSGQFSSQPIAQPQAEYPALQPIPISEPMPAAHQHPHSGAEHHDSIASEMAALERDLAIAQQQQQQFAQQPLPEVAFEPAPLPQQYTQQPLPEAAFEAPIQPAAAYDQAPPLEQPPAFEAAQPQLAASADTLPSLLPPPPPINNGVADLYAAQPLPEPAYNAPQATYAPLEQPSYNASYDPAYSAEASYDVPVAPALYEAPAATAITSLTPPPARNAGYDYLPPSRYEGRRLRSY